MRQRRARGVFGNTALGARARRAVGRGLFGGVLRWAHAHGCPLHPEMCYFASKTRSLERLEYAYTHGCALSSEALRAALFHEEWTMCAWILARIRVPLNQLTRYALADARRKNIL